MIWNANEYQIFKNERLQPTLDLINRLPNLNYKSILDIGCGSGMSTFPLEKRYPQANIVGVDMSSEMLEKAKQTKSTIQWVQRDCSKPLDDLGRFDLIFSNAFLHWLGSLDNQEKFLSNVSKMLNPNGVLAVQLPNRNDMEVNMCIDAVASEYGTKFADIKKILNNCSINDYYNMLLKSYDKVQIWQTNYGHILNTHEEIIKFVGSTGLKPYLSILNDTQKLEFSSKLIEKLKECYPTCNDGKLIFTFKRIFFIATKNVWEG